MNKTEYILDRIKHGPEADDGPVARILGAWLWWRTYAAGGLAITPVIAGWIALSYLSPPMAVLVTALVGMFAYDSAWEPYRGQRGDRRDRQ